MAARKIPVKFANTAGKMLFGIIHEPIETLDNVPAVILLSPGIKSRVAPHRLYIDIANRLSAFGLLVLRFDFEGLGDSEGEFSEELADDLYGQIQQGRLVGDVDSAMDFLSANYGTRKLILCGLCGGAITGLLAAANNLRVEAVIGIGTPVIMSGTKYRSAEFMTQGQLKQFRRGYLRRVFSFKAWIRLLTLKTDYRALFRSLFLFKTGGRQTEIRGTEERSSPASVDASSNLNRLFPLAIRRISDTSRCAYLIFGENDRLRWEFEEKYLPTVDGGLGSLDGVDVYISPQARHVFEFPDQKHDLINHIEQWISSRYAPVRTATDIKGGLHVG